VCALALLKVVDLKMLFVIFSKGKELKNALPQLILNTGVDA
jgi:hypothetical protein